MQLDASVAVEKGPGLPDAQAIWRVRIDLTVLHGRVVLFEDVEQPKRLFRDEAESNRVSLGVGGKVRALAASVAVVTEFAQMVFRRHYWLTGGGVAKPRITLTERDARAVGPKLVPWARFEERLRFEIRTAHRRYPSRLASSRIDVLRQLLEQNPGSTFARYGLAMEYVKSGDLETAVTEFKAILATEPSYSAAYFHGGQALEKLGRLDDARALYRDGIANTRDPHARSEMQAALDILGD